MKQVFSFRVSEKELRDFVGKCEANGKKPTVVARGLVEAFNRGKSN